MITAFAVFGFVAFLLVVVAFLLTVAFGSTALALTRQLLQRPMIDLSELDAEADAFAAIGDGLASVRAATDPLALARLQAERLAACLAGRLGDHHPAVVSVEHVALRLGASAPRSRYLVDQPRDFRMLVDELEETRTLARLLGTCVRLRDQHAEAGRRADAYQYGVTPLGILEDCVIPALRWGRLTLTTCNTPRTITA